MGQCTGPLVLSSILTRLSMLRFFEKIFAIKSWSRRKTKQMYMHFGPKFLEGTTPTFLRQIVSEINCQPFGKLWSTSVCLSPSAKPGNEVKCRIYGGRVKMTVQFWAVCWPKFMTFREDVYETPCSVQRTCPIMYIAFLSEDIGR